MLLFKCLCAFVFFFIIVAVISSKDDYETEYCEGKYRD